MMFKDLLVVELASVLAGPLVGSFFSELGARVIKVENPGTGGDITRKWKLSHEDPEAPVSAYYASANYNKQIEYLNISDSADHQELLKMVKIADLVIVNYKVDSALRLGIDYESLKRVNENIIYASITGYGYEDKRPAFDMVLQAECGLLSMTGEADRAPSKVPVAIIDILAAHHLKQAILCAMLRKKDTGEGSFVTVSLYDSAMAMLINQASNYLMTGVVAQRMGSKHPNIAPYGDSFQCKDGKYLIMAVGTEKQFKSLSDLLNLEYDKYHNNVLRLERRDKLCSDIASKIAIHDLSHWKQLFLEQSIPFSPVYDLSEALETDEAKKRILESVVEGMSTKRMRTAYI